MKIVMVGTGYVGLVSGACFTEIGHRVICVDNDAGNIGSLRKGRAPIYEKHLENLIECHVRSERLSFTTNQAVAIEGSCHRMESVPLA